MCEQSSAAFVTASSHSPPPTVHHHLQTIVDLPKLASDTMPSLNLEEELKKRLLPSPPPSPREKRCSIKSLYCNIVANPLNCYMQCTCSISWYVVHVVDILCCCRKRKLVLSGPEAQKKLREGTCTIHVFGKVTLCTRQIIGQGYFNCESTSVCVCVL